MYCNTARFGQIFTYSLASLQSIMSYKSTYTQNEPSIIVDYNFDKDQNYFLHLDRTGNFQSIDYEGQFVIYNLIKLAEYNSNSEYLILGFSIDFRNNNLLIFSQSQVFHSDYGDLSNGFTKFRQSKKQLFAEITYISVSSNSSEIQDNTFVIAGEDGLLYKYFDSNFEYYFQFSQDIQALQYLPNQKILIVALSNKLVLFENSTQNSVRSQSGWQGNQEEITLNSSFSKFICDDLFQTKDKTIVHYDYLNKNILKSITISADPNIRVTKEICSAFTQYLFLGLNNGDVIAYDRKAYTLNTVMLVSQVQGQVLASLEIGYLMETSLHLWVCFSSTQGVFKIKNDLSESLQILTYDDMDKYNMDIPLNVGIFQVDNSNQRLFISFIGEKLMRVYNIQNDQALFQAYVSLPNRLNNRLYLSSSHLIVYSRFHVMIYDKITLAYIQRIRRQNTLDFITELAEIWNKYILLMFEHKYEMFSIDESKDEATLLDQIVLSDSVLMKSTLQSDNSNQNSILQVIILTLNSVFEQRYSLDYEESSGTDKTCSMIAEVSSFTEMTQSIQSIRPSYYPDPTSRFMNVASDSSVNNYWMINLKTNNLETINFNGTVNSLMQVYSISQSSGNDEQLMLLDISTNSFEIFTKEEIQIRDFQLNFIMPGNIAFSTVSKSIIFHNLYITQQSLNNISFQFTNLNKVVINQIYLSNTQRSSNSQSASSYFLYFEYCDSVFIYDLTLKNLDWQTNPFEALLFAKNVNLLVIKNVTIQETLLSNLIKIIQVQTLIIENIIISQCGMEDDADRQIFNPYIFQIIGVQNAELTLLKLLKSINIFFILTDNMYSDSGRSIQLQQDTISIDNLQVEDNIVRFSNQESIIKIKNSFILLNNIAFNNNQGNVMISGCQNVSIQNSLFTLNSCLDGGSLAIISCLNMIEFQSVQFTKNQAFASGGAVYFENVNAQIKMDKETVRIEENSALIGGGVRLYNIEEDLQQELSFHYGDIIKNNNADIYGKNFATFLVQVEIILDDKYNPNDDNGDSFDDPLFFSIKQFNQMTNLEKQLWQTMVTISNFKSGGNLKISLKLIDSEGSYLTFLLDTFQKNKYPPSIQNELSLMQFKIEATSSSSSSQYTTTNVLISGQNVISADNFDQNSNQFIFKSIQITSIPIAVSELQILNIYTPSIYLSRKPNYIQLIMRVCEVGEVVKIINDDIFSCSSCPTGFYSLSDPTKDQFWGQYISKSAPQQNIATVDKFECQKCPDSATSCQNKQINLKSGYWRANENSTDIVQCDVVLNACDFESPNNKFGCIEGYIGPLCMECDTIGKIWNSIRYSHSYTNNFKCVKCNSLSYQIFFLVLTIISLIFYFMVSIILFMNNFIHQQVCQYLRLLKIIPISRNSIQDQSSFYLKILINYIQISSVLVSLQISFFPDLISSIPNYLGQSANQVVVSIDCIISEDYIRHYGRAQIIQVIQASMPLLFLVILLLIMAVCMKFKLFQIKRFHRYTLLNFIFVFFQPDQINFFSKQLTCKQIGQKKYVSSDLQIECGNSDYNYFTNTIAIPLIIFWSILPIFIFYQLRKKSNELSTCFTKYKFGYFYTEFKSKYFYWEFIRIYVRVFIVVIFTIIQTQSFQSYQIIIFALYMYIKMTIYCNPIRNNTLQSFDIASYNILILNSILATINTGVNSQIITGIIYSLHYTFIFGILFAIISFKISNPLTFVGKSCHFLLLRFLPQSLYIQYIRNSRVKFQTFLNWKKVYRNMSFLVNQQAINRVSKVQTDEKNVLNSKGVFNSYSASQALININSKQLSNFQMQKYRSYQEINHKFQVDITTNKNSICLQKNDKMNDFIKSNFTEEQNFNLMSPQFRKTQDIEKSDSLCDEIGQQAFDSEIILKKISSNPKGNNQNVFQKQYETKFKNKQILDKTESNKNYVDNLDLKNSLNY